MARTFRPATVLMASSALALTLSACKIDNRPLLARDAPAYGGLPAPGPLDLAYAPPAPMAAYAQPVDRYAYARRAYGVDRAIYDAPPAYRFAYGDQQPWAWQTADDRLMYAEPIDNGYRSYYYEPGQDYPYFVRDPSYGYGYGPDGALVALYDAAGALLSGDRYAEAAPLAGRYWARAYGLRRTALRERRAPVDEGVWRRRGWDGGGDRGGGRDWNGGEGRAPQQIAQDQHSRWGGGDHGGGDHGHEGGDGGGRSAHDGGGHGEGGGGGGDHGGGDHGGGHGHEH
ncbi:MAG: hypothetical protein JWQ46_2545 [Phenylobacterium sp.]|nr:hypothetical protein [Phenylobacterium sp.]